MRERPDPMTVDLRRCLVPQGALEFVCACSAGHGLLVADWLASDPGGESAPGNPQRLPTGFRAALDRALRQPAPTRPVAIPFDPLDYLRDPASWRPPAGIPPGSSHSQKVWEAIRGIPVGETRSYGDIARAIGSSARAVGQACRANPWPLFIPCHRVVPTSASDSGAGGYSGQKQGPLADIKGWLLNHEMPGTRPGIGTSCPLP